MRKLILLGALTTVLLGASATGASATTWSGSCHMAGTIRITDSPLTFRLEHHDFEVTGKGRCEGTLNGEPYNGPAHNFMDGRMNAPFSCEAGISHDVPGAITFGDDPNAVDVTKLDMVISANFYAGPAAPALLEGAYNGHGWGAIDLVANETALEDCAGSGISEIDYEVQLHTTTPFHG